MLAALTRPMGREEWARAAHVMLARYPYRELGELILAGFVQKVSGPDGNVFVRIREFPDGGGQ